MNTVSKRIVVSLGILAGSLAIAPIAQADIPISGGRATGDAAFFSPRTNSTNSSGTTSSGSTSSTPTTTPAAPILFDATIKTLRIETQNNGTTSTSRFIPSASNFVDVNNNGRPDRLDTGTLRGTLSGVAFSTSGSPVFFQGVPTTLDFTLDSFSSNFIQGGTLISPKQEGTAPRVFLPIQNVTLSSSSSNNFESQTGLLEVGPFQATLTGDFVGLPSDLQLRSTGDTSFPITELGRRIKFDFEGRNVTAEDGDVTTEAITFTAPTTSFKVQSVGTPGTQEFKIEGTTADLDIELKAPFSLEQRGTVDFDRPIDYEIRGEGPGYVAFGGTNSVSFTGTSRRDTRFRVEQGNNRLDGRSSGDVNFTLIGANDDFSAGFTPITTISNNGTLFTPSTTTVVTIVQNPTVTNLSLTPRPSFTTTQVVTSTVTYINLFNVYNSSVSVPNGDDDDDDDDNEGTNVVYTIYQPRGPVQVVVEQDDDRIIVVERERRGRGLARGQRGRVISAYQVIGLPSRVFPGLVGLQQIPAEQVQSTTTETTTPSGTTSTEGTTTPSSTTTPGTTSTEGTTAPTEGTTTPSGTTTTP